MKPKYFMSFAGRRRGLLVYKFWSTGKWPFYHGSTMCRSFDEGINAFRAWIPESGIKLRIPQ